MVNVIETCEVHTPPPHLVWTKLFKQLWVPVLNAANEIHDKVCLAR